ncbi:ATP-grasp domain-containing protein [Botrimarina hoheduenensis]|uniref:Carbamoyl phosphate synthase-like protein n=1 Tax=Botrimarina hoheduenensis TaxID=2528000 RepID=A0A5C5VVQ4_9BACT|nr:ATP-grasp domain-containing protein [Botrimarina hoheduenensis]TWT42756.1 carbamoyl phosphate synthase-like protein [Botrimarina hoheduenensis]
MRLFVYEWVTGGGMAGREGRLPDSLLREGLAMVQAVAADAAAARIEVTLMRDLGVPLIGVPSAQITSVDSRSAHDRLFAEFAAEADATIVIAPETDGALLAAVSAAEKVGARLASPGSEVVRLTADKRLTAACLSQAGVPTPESLYLEAGAPLPRDFAYPAVIKPIDGAGSQDTHAVMSVADAPPAYAWPRLLQRYAVGMPASVALISDGTAEPLLLPACRQRLSGDGRFRYLGGQTPLPDALTERAHRLARATLAALPAAVGYLGIDLVLGDDPAGARDLVIEVNPRLTTSLVGLRAACRESLVAAMIDAQQGRRATLSFDPRPLEFDADGTVYYAAL